MIKTLVIDNFKGQLTSYESGDINSGRSLIAVCSGQNPFLKPGSLTWNEAPVQIDSAGSVITDLILAGKERVESGILYVYAIGHTGRLYKIQVNDPTTFNPDYDNPVLLTTLTSGTPTFTRGAFIDFFGTTEKIYIGHDKGVTNVNFDGTGEAVVGAAVSWTQTVPRPLKQFVGNLYAGNGTNIAEIIQAGTVSTYTKLSPSFPNNTQVRDIDLSVEGNYIDIIVSRLSLFDVTSATQETISTANSESYIFKWNGTDVGYTAFSTFPTFSLDANTLFQNYQYTFGKDQFGTAVYNPTEKLFAIPESPGIMPNAISSTANLLTVMSPLYFNSVLEADMYCWGSFDFEIGQPPGVWDLFFVNATSPETDIVRVPLQLPVSNTGLGSSSNGYSGSLYGSSKIYFSTLETSSAPTTKYRFYKWRPVTSPQVAVGTVLTDAIYQTQTQIFSKKITIKQVRVYGEPWVANNAFEIDLCGSDLNPITNGTYTFTAGSNLTIGDDFAWWTPDIAPTYALGIAVINKGTANHVINKIEIDYNIGGQ